MAVVLIEGWDHLTAAEMTAKGWSAAPSSMPAGRFDGQCAVMGGATLRGKTLPSSLATVIAGFGYQWNTTGQTVSPWFYLRASTTNVLRIQLDSLNRLQVVNSAGTVIATGTTTIAQATWHYIEIKLVVGTSGSCELHLDGNSGSPEITTTTGNFGTSNVDNIGFDGHTGPSIDDVYVVDTTGSAPRNTFLGDVRVHTIAPTADGAHTAWTPNSGTTHYTQVDETLADGDTSYVSDSTPGDIDTYVCGDIDTGATVYGVQTNLYARKDDANTRQIAPLIRQSSTDYVGTTVTLTSSYADYTQIYNQDPTGSDWTAANVNADEFGVKEIA